MKPPEEIFNELFATHGGRLHPLQAHLSLSLEIHRQRMHHWIKLTKLDAESSSIHRVYFDYVANGTINAAATEMDGFGYVGFNWGTIIVLGDLFCRMFSHPEVLKSIGNAAGEFLDPVFQDGVTLDGDSLQKRRWGIEGPQENRIWAAMPRDRLRSLAAEICRLLTLDFLCLHELAHIGYGHIGYIREKYGMSFLLELDHSSNPPDQQVTRQALEMNADAFAASTSLTTFLNNREHLVEYIPEIGVLMGDEVALFLWSFAITSLFYVFEPTFDLSLLASGSHLPASVRFEGNVRCGLDAAMEAHPIIKNLFVTKELNLRHVVHAFECIGFKWPTDKVSRYIECRDDKRLEEHVQQVISRFRILKPELKQYSRFDLERGFPS